MPQQDITYATTAQQCHIEDMKVIINVGSNKYTFHEIEITLKMLICLFLPLKSNICAKCVL